MMYTVFAAALSAGLITFTIGSKRCHRYRKAIAAVDLILAILGGVLLSAVGIIARISIFGGSFDPEWTDWAWGRMVVYYRISLLIVGILLGFLLLSFLLGRLDPKQETHTRHLMRIAVSTASSILILLVTPFYAYMLQNTALPLVEYVLFSGVGQALLFRLIPLLSALAPENSK
jgi:hypothetical protein